MEAPAKQPTAAAELEGDLSKAKGGRSDRARTEVECPGTPKSSDIPAQSKLFLPEQ